VPDNLDIEENEEQENPFERIPPAKKSSKNKHLVLLIGAVFLLGIYLLVANVLFTDEESSGPVITQDKIAESIRATEPPASELEMVKELVAKEPLEKIYEEKIVLRNQPKRMAKEETIIEIEEATRVTPAEETSAKVSQAASRMEGGSPASTESPPGEIAEKLAKERLAIEVPSVPEKPVEVKPDEIQMASLPKPEEPAANAPPAPEPVVKSDERSTPAGTDRGTYSVQVGSFLTRQAADKSYRDLVRRGYEAYVSTGKAMMKYYRVQVGEYRTAAECRTAARQLAGHGIQTNMVYLKDRRLTLSVGSFFDQGEAEKYHKRTMEVTDQAVLKTVEDVSEVYIVRVGKMASLDGAKSMEAKLREDGFSPIGIKGS
jgi:cell division protein FtsN